MSVAGCIYPIETLGAKFVILQAPGYKKAPEKGAALRKMLPKHQEYYLRLHEPLIFPPINWGDAFTATGLERLRAEAQKSAKKNRARNAAAFQPVLALIRKRDFLSAEQQLEHIRGASVGDAESLRLLGDFHRGLGNIEEMLSCYMAAHELRPMFEEWFFTMLMEYFAAHGHEPKDIIKYYTLRVRHFPQKSLYWYSIADCLFKQKDPELGLKYLRKSASLKDATDEIRAEYDCLQGTIDWLLNGDPIAAKQRFSVGARTSMDGMVDFDSVVLSRLLSIDQNLLALGKLKTLEYIRDQSRLLLRELRVLEPLHDPDYRGLLADYHKSRLDAVRRILMLLEPQASRSDVLMRSSEATLELACSEFKELRGVLKWRKTVQAWGGKRRRKREDDRAIFKMSQSPWWNPWLEHLTKFEASCGRALRKYKEASQIPVEVQKRLIALLVNPLSEATERTQDQNDLKDAMVNLWEEWTRKAESKKAQAVDKWLGNKKVQQVTPSISGIQSAVATDPDMVLENLRQNGRLVFTPATIDLARAFSRGWTDDHICQKLSLKAKNLSVLRGKMFRNLGIVGGRKLDLRKKLFHVLGPRLYEKFKRGEFRFYSKK